MGGNQVENHTTSWSNLQDCKISSRVEIPKLDPSVAKKDMYQVLLGVYLCQRWIVDLKGIMQPVLFRIFFSDFVTPQNAPCLKDVGYLV